MHVLHLCIVCVLCTVVDVCCDTLGLVRSVKPEDFTRHIIYLNEKGIKVAEEASRKVTTIL